MHLGKAIRLGRLFDDRSGRLLAITLDHAIARGVLPGLVDVESALASVAAGKPDAITLQKGIASRVFSPTYSADGISLILKATSYSPFHPTLDTPTATVEEALRLGADAISVGVLVGEPNQAQQLTHLSRISRFWTQIKADITGKRYRRAGEVQSASRGAATLAAVGLGAHKDAWAASEAMGSPESEPVEPTADPDLRVVYDRRYLVFKSLYPSLRQHFGELRDRASEPREKQGAMKLSASETWGIGAGRLGKQT